MTLVLPRFERDQAKLAASVTSARGARRLGLRLVLMWLRVSGKWEYLAGLFFAPLVVNGTPVAIVRMTTKGTSVDFLVYGVLLLCALLTVRVIWLCTRNIRECRRSRGAWDAESIIAMAGFIFSFACSVFIAVM
jgi:hypothetical protein